jgi:glycosyltransferase involved in cell wall biosynthesis
MKLSIIMPVYNEINTIAEILRQVHKVPYDKEIIVVDDGSTDGTREFLREISESNVRVFFHEKNSGKGAALQTGLGHVQGDIVIIQDADLEYYPDEYHLLIDKIVDGKAEVVYGNRFLGARRIFHFYHYVGNRFINLIANVIYNKHISDFMTCYKAFRSDAFDGLKLRAKGFAIEAEITAHFFKKNVRIYEVPISYNGRDYEHGKKITWKDFFRCLYWLTKCRVESSGTKSSGNVRKTARHNKRLFELVKPYLGNCILELASGAGSFSLLLSSLGKKLLLTVDDERHLLDLKDQFIGNPNITIYKYRKLEDLPSQLQDRRIDTILCINLLQTLKDDGKALKTISSILAPKGRLVLFVPATNSLYRGRDGKLQDYRRYAKKDLICLLEKSGLAVQEIFYQGASLMAVCVKKN